MKYIVKTDTGVVRKENQDRADVFEKDGIVFAVLCDGMGGHEGGVHASKITVDVFGRSFQNKLPTDPKEYTEWFKNTLTQAKNEMTQFAGSNEGLMDMGTTVTTALITDKLIYIFNVGDSRTYIYNGLLHQITVDHNVRNYFIKKFEYTPEEAATIKGAAALTSALGPTKKTKMEQFLVERDENIEYILLTSDGIHDFIEKPIIENIISLDAPIKKKGSLLIKNAIKSKSSDNLTAIIVEMK